MDEQSYFNFYLDKIRETASDDFVNELEDLFNQIKKQNNLELLDNFLTFVKNLSSEIDNISDLSNYSF